MYTAGVLSPVSNLISTTVDSCTLHFTWIAPSSLEGVTISYTINITDTNEMMLRTDTTNTTEYLYSVSSLGETLEIEVTAVNGAGAGNTTIIMTQTPSSSEPLLHVDLISHVCMNIVNDVEFISTLMNTMRTNSATNNNWTCTFDLEVIINMVIKKFVSILFLCAGNICVYQSYQSCYC